MTVSIADETGNVIRGGAFGASQGRAREFGERRAKYFGVRFGPEVRMIQQERAYTSPIWYTP